VNHWIYLEQVSCNPDAFPVAEPWVTEWPSTGENETKPRPLHLTWESWKQWTACDVHSWEYCALDSFVDFGTMYVVCLFTSCASPIILFSSLFSLLIFSFENRYAPFPCWFLLHAVNCGRFCFWRCQSVFFVCVWNISETAERICTEFTRKTCLVPPRTSLKVKDQGHQGQKLHFSALSAVCVQFLVSCFILILVLVKYSAGNTVEQNSSVFSLIRMR